MLYFSSKIELDMDQEQEINNLKRKLLDLSYDYYKFRVSLYCKPPIKYPLSLYL
jgi:hypothetical protein